MLWQISPPPPAPTSCHTKQAFIQTKLLDCIGEGMGMGGKDWIKPEICKHNTLYLLL